VFFAVNTSVCVRVLSFQPHSRHCDMSRHTAYGDSKTQATGSVFPRFGTPEAARFAARVDAALDRAEQSAATARGSCGGTGSPWSYRPADAVTFGGRQTSSQSEAALARYRDDSARASFVFGGENRRHESGRF